MTAEELLTTILNAGGRIIPDPGRPRLGVPTGLKPFVAEHRLALRRLVLARLGQGSESDAQDPAVLSRLLSMPLDEFALGGQLLEVRVPYLTQTLWFVPGEADADRLTLEGISRGRIWTARELADLLSCAGLTPDQVRAVALAKIELGGDVVEIRHQ